MGAMADIQSGQTIGQLCEKHGRTKDSVRKKWARTIGGQFSADHVPSESEMSVLFPGKKSGNVRVKSEEKERPAKAAPAVSEAMGAQGKSSVRITLLWLVLALSVACSVPNMFGVMLAMKGDWSLAFIATLAFTVAPFMLIGAGVKGAAHMVVYVVILVEVFCNTAGFYGGMTGLSHATFIEPSTFLHMVTSMLNTDYESTALFLSLAMAVCIALLAAVPVYNLRNKSK